jgi:hypothetical protein
VRGTRIARARTGRAVAALLVLAPLLAGALPPTPAGAAPRPSAEPHGTCDVLDPAACLLPFPNDYFTVADPSTATGRRVDFEPQAMPTNAAGAAIDPVPYDRNDGFSPGSAVLTFVPGLDLARTGVAPSTDIGRSLDPNAPIVLLDATTGRRVPSWAELDQTAPAGRQLLIVRPAVNFPEGHHIIVALRQLRTASGQTIPAGPAFAALRDDRPTTNPAIEARRAHFDALFAALARAGVARHDLYLAWDFTIASERSLAGSMLHMRDDAFASLQGHAPGFHVATVATNPDPGVARLVTGTFEVPSYLTGTGGSGSTLALAADGLPERTGTYSARFECIVPDAALSSDGTVHPARPGVYGHGLLGNETEVTAPDVRAMAEEHDFVFCATRWIGLSSEDLATVAAALQNLSLFPTIPDRLQQAILNTLMLGRLMISPDGLASNPAFRGPSGASVIDRRELFYDGNSLGGILGGAATAVAQDWTRAVLGVPGMNFSTLLQRSVDYDPYMQISDQAYPDPMTRTLTLSIVQMLWDRGEADGYAEHLTDDPYPGTPRHTVLLDEAFGDHQVANVATEVEARTIGARTHRPALASGRSPDRTPLWGIPTIASYPYRGSALILWDSGTPAPPPGNQPNRIGHDPHPDPRSSPAARRQKSAFLSVHGALINVCGDQPCRDRPANP